MTAPDWQDDITPPEVLNWALGTYPSLTLTSGFNLNGVVLIDMAVKAGYRGEVLFVDTGYHFEATLRTRDALSQRYPLLDFVTLSAERPDDRMYLRDTGRCCALRKLAPLQTYLDKTAPAAILSARSREQSDSRSNLGLVERGARRDKINPLLHWTRQALERYAETHTLPINPLYKDGFLSIGCAPCTRAVRPGEDVRAGRWAGTGKTECGLWTSDAL